MGLFLPESSTISYALGCQPRAREHYTSDTRWDYVSVKELAHPETPTIPVVHVGEPDLGAYDELLTAVAS